MYSIFLTYIFQTFFDGSKCVLYLNSSNYDTTKPENNEQILNYIRDKYTVYTLSELDNLDLLTVHCRNFIFNMQHPSTSINILEKYLQRNTSGSYSNRKYLIFLGENDTFPEGVDAMKFTFNVLVVRIKKDVFELYNQNYKVDRQGRGFVLNNIWFRHNFSLKYDTDNSSWDEMSTQLGRELAIGLTNNIPYVNIYDRTGAELRVVIQYAEMYNLSLKIYSTMEMNGWGAVNNWAATKGSVRELFLADQIDFTIGAHILSSASMKHFDFSSPVSIFKGECIVQLPTIKYDWLFALNITDLYFWILVLITYILIAFLIICRQYRIKENYFGFFKLYGVAVNQSLNKAHMSQDFFLRLSFVIFLLFGIVFSTMYNSSVSSRLSAPEYAEDIRTISDVIRDKIPWLGSTENYLIPLIHGQKRLLVSQFHLASTELLQNLLQNKTKFAYIGMQAQSRLFFPDTIDYGVKLVLDEYKLMDEEFMEEYTYFCLRKNSVYRDSLDRLIRQCYDTGLLLKWERQSFYASHSIIDQHKIQDRNILSEVKPASMEQMKSLFLFWNVGLLLSFVCFICEVSCRKRGNLYENVV